MAKFRADSKFFEGKAVYIIGGGSSLSEFPWKTLKNLNTIGCNTAFELGHEICKMCFFGDMLFFERNKHNLVNYKGTLVTSFSGLYETTVDWIHTMKRQDRGLSDKADTLAWNHNSGASAINLALLLGAKKVYLLGFDNYADQDTRNNWHEKSVFEFRKSVYARHAQGLEEVARLQPQLFPEAEIINLNPHSNLDCFPKKTLKRFPHQPPTEV